MGQRETVQIKFGDKCGLINGVVNKIPGRNFAGILGNDQIRDFRVMDLTKIVDF